MMRCDQMRHDVRDDVRRGESAPGRPAAGSTSRAGFTLVELLVVIIIIAVISSLAIPAVMRAQNSARNAAIKVEIDQLHMAIMNYKNEYGSFPPCQNVQSVLTDWGPSHLKRLFPRCTAPATQVPDLNPATSMAFWLAGFSDDPTQPITGGKRKKLFDLDASRLFTQGFLDGRGVYVPRDKPGSPYIYIDSRLYKKIDGTPQTWPPAPATYTTNSGDARTIEIATYRAQQMPNGTFFNEDTFQILCAGRDEKFGTDDDLSNFWPGTRLDYIDSVK